MASERESSRANTFKKTNLAMGTVDEHCGLRCTFVVHQSNVVISTMLLGSSLLVLSPTVQAASAQRMHLHSPCTCPPATSATCGQNVKEGFNVRGTKLGCISAGASWSKAWTNSCEESELGICSEGMCLPSFRTGFHVTCGKDLSIFFSTRG